jgi:hypothetical protein
MRKSWEVLGNTVTGLKEANRALCLPPECFPPDRKQETPTLRRNRVSSHS